MKFFYVYLLRSINKPDWIYVGYTENLKERLKGHNSGDSKSTTHYKPFELIHYEAYRSRRDAKRRELYLKTAKGKTTIRTMLKDFLSEV